MVINNGYKQWFHKEVLAKGLRGIKQRFYRNFNNRIRGFNSVFNNGTKQWYQLEDRNKGYH